MSTKQAMIDAVTLRQILMERYSKGEARRLYKHIRRLDNLLEKKVLAKYGKERAVILGKEVEKISNELLTLYGNDLIASLESFAVKESEFAKQLLIASTSATSIKSPSLLSVKKSVNSQTMNLLVGGKLQKVTINQAIKQFSTAQSKKIGQIIKDGSLSGRTTDEMVEEISDLVRARTRQQAETLVRTTTNKTATGAREATFDENDDIFDGWQWLSTLDSRTSLTCAGLDGKKFQEGKQSKPPIHWGCRSSFIRLVKPEFDLGSEIEGKRSSDSGYVSAKLTYGGWLKKQGKPVQVEVLGTKRAKLFRSGEVSISNFTDRSGQTLTLDQLEAKNSLSFS